MKRKTKSIFAVVFAIILLLLVVVTLFTNIAFSRSDTPKLFGHYVYMMESDTMEAPVATDVTSLSADGADGTDAASSDANAAASIHQYTAVIAKEYDASDPVAKNNAVLCRLAEGDTSTDVDSDGIAVRRIYNIEQDSTGVLLYYPTTMRADAVGSPITIDNILGKCTYQSGELYSFISFATGVSGILLLLVLPSVILVIMLIVAIARANSKREDEFAFEENYDEVYSEDSYDDDGAGYSEEDLGRTSIYRSPASTSSFERRRSSIAQNFERKAVNPNSPYQKARTMQFKAQHDVPIYTDPEEQIPLGGASSRGSAIYTDDSYEGAHSGAVSNTGRFGTRRTQNTDDTMIAHIDSEPTVPSTPTAPQETGSGRYRGTHEAGSPDEARNLGSSRFGSGASSRPSTPRSTTSSRSSKNKYENASVDELLAMIEDEKKKLDQ